MRCPRGRDPVTAPQSEKIVSDPLSSLIPDEPYDELAPPSLPELAVASWSAVRVEDYSGPVAREVQVLVDLAQLAANRKAAEEQMAAQFDAATRSATRSLESARQAFDAELETARRDAANDVSEMRRHALTRFQTESAAVQQELTDLERRTDEEFHGTQQRAFQKLKESRWEAEAVFEAAKVVGPKQLGQLEHTLGTWRERVRVEKEEADRLLSDWGFQELRDGALPVEPLEIPPGDLAGRLQHCVDLVSGLRGELSELSLPALVRSLLLIWGAILVGVLLGAVLFALQLPPIVAVAAAVIVTVMGIGLRWYLRRVAASQMLETYPALCQAAQHAEGLMQAALDESRARAASRLTELTARHQATLSAADQQYDATIGEINSQRDERIAQASSYPQKLAEITARRDRDLELAEAHRQRTAADIARREGQWFTIAQQHQKLVDQVTTRRVQQAQAVTQAWDDGLHRAVREIVALRGETTEASLGWLSDWNALAEGWQPAASVPSGIRFGDLRVRMAQIPGGVPEDPTQAALTPDDFTLPALLTFPDRLSLLLRAPASARAVAAEVLQAVMLRLLVLVPPGKLRFTIIDPVGLGENFAAFMHLADFNEQLVTSRIWTEPRHIEQRLADISEHMENVIQKYLRNEYQTIEQYNREAGEIAEPYRFLVIAGFPTNFNEAAQRRLLSIAASGARCGVYVLMVADAQMPTNRGGVSLRDLEACATTLIWRDGRFVWKDDLFGQFELTLDDLPSPEAVTEILQTAGRYALDASKVEVPFAVIAPPAEEFWTSSARAGIDVPLGRAGATRLQALKLGKGTSQHVLVAGKTGSGKSTLLHALVTNIAVRYSPDEIELYLIDFKQGVEFKTYASHSLPHARVVAIESDREFGVSVLGRLDGELKLRADRFRAAGVQDLAGFRDAEPGISMPRILLIVDEFQEFFVEDDKISQDASLLLDRLVRQGRAFGIHVLLGSQTLAGTYSLARSTLGQMAVRIALQCSEADAHLILSDDNSAARLLSRPGEAIYNDSNGLIEGNHPFQVVWLSDETRDSYLEEVPALLARSGIVPRPQVVFEGNIAADPARNHLLAELLAAGRPDQAPLAPHAWLGDAVAIKDPTLVTFRRQSGGNLLMVGQNEESALGILTTSMVSLAAQLPCEASDGTRFYVIDGSAAGSVESQCLGQLPELTSDPARLVNPRELPAAVNDLAMELQRRNQSTESQFAPVFVFVYGLQRLRDLRKSEDDYGFSRSSENRPPDPSKQFATLLREGPAVGIHTIVWCDSVNNLNRAWDRQTLREFELRVAFQMSVNDSSTFIDTPAAGKLGTHRAFFHSEEQAILEKFRPYRWPEADWLRLVRQQLGGAEQKSRSQPAVMD